MSQLFVVEIYLYFLYYVYVMGYKKYIILQIYNYMQYLIIIGINGYSVDKM
jgi:hypothetical protein